MGIRYSSVKAEKRILKEDGEKINFAPYDHPNVRTLDQALKLHAIKNVMRANDERILIDVAAKRPNMNDPVNISMLRTRPVFMPLDHQYITQDHSIGVDG